MKRRTLFKLLSGLPFMGFVKPMVTRTKVIQGPGILWYYSDNGDYNLPQGTFDLAAQKLADHIDGQVLGDLEELIAQQLFPCPPPADGC